MSLSDKITRLFETVATLTDKEPLIIGEYVVKADDVRESVLRLKKFINNTRNASGRRNHEYIDEIFGEKLI